MAFLIKEKQQKMANFCSSAECCVSFIYGEVDLCLIVVAVVSFGAR